MKKKNNSVNLVALLVLSLTTVNCAFKLSGTYVSDKGNHIFRIVEDSSFSYERILGTLYSHSKGTLNKVGKNIYVVTSSNLSLLIPVEFSTSTSQKVEEKKVIKVNSKVDCDIRFRDLYYYNLVFNDSINCGPYKVSTEMFLIKFVGEISSIQMKVFSDEGLAMIAGDTLFSNKYFPRSDFTALNITANINHDFFRYKMFQ
jgi:hypothetical protein